MDFEGKCIKVIHYNLETKMFYKITYGFVKNHIKIPNEDSFMFLIGSFYSKNIDENGKFIDGAKLSQTCYVYKTEDCYREVKEDEFEFFKNNIFDEIKEYEQNNKLLQ